VVLLELLVTRATSVNAEDAGCYNMKLKIPTMMKLKSINNVISVREVMEVINRIHHHQLHQSHHLRPLHLHRKFAGVSFRRHLHLHLHQLLHLAPRSLPRIRVMKQRVASRVASGVMTVDSRLMVKVNAALGFE
jgi:hypothetical protein